MKKPSRPEPFDADLDARIVAAEHAVIERDERVRHHVAALGAGIRSGAGLGLLGGAAVALCGFLLARLLPSRRRRVQPHAPPRRIAEAPPWPRLLALVLPLLPLALRGRLSPATASLFTGIALPLIGRLLGRRR